MKFYGEPNQFVRFATASLRNGNKLGIRFDENGIYKTENKRIIQALKRRFKYEDETLPLEVKDNSVEANTQLNSDAVEEEKEVLEVNEEVKKPTRKKGVK